MLIINRTTKFAATASAFVTASFLLAQVAEAGTVYRISQESAAGAGDFNSNVLGFINAFETTETIQDYYGFNSPNVNSFSGPAPTLTSQRSHLFLVDGADGLALFSVHNKSGSGKVSGNNAKMRFDLRGGDTASFLVLDDPSDTTIDSYLQTNSTTFETDHTWESKYSDGVAIGSLDEDWTMFSEFTAAPTGKAKLTSWGAVSANNSTINLALAPNRRVRIDPFFSLIDEGTDEVAFRVNKPANQLLRVEGRAGADDLRGDYEVGIGAEGAQPGLTGQLQLDWVNGQNYEWDLAWNPESNTATFEITNPDDLQQPISHTFTGTGPDIFNAFGIFAKASTDSKVDPNTSISLGIDKINGLNLAVGSTTGPISVQANSPTLGQDIVKRFFSSTGGTEITSVSGDFQMNWQGKNPQDSKARSRVDFQFTLFDPPVTTSSAAAPTQSVPEPTSILSLLVAGAFGTSFIRKSSKKKQQF